MSSGEKVHTPIKQTGKTESLADRFSSEDLQWCTPTLVSRLVFDMFRDELERVAHEPRGERDLINRPHRIPQP
jgi:hypothetical protein